MTSSTPMLRPVPPAPAVPSAHRVRFRTRFQRASVLAILPLSLGGVRPRPPHLELKRSEPTAGSRLSVAPTRITLWFTAKPQLPFTRIRLAGPPGTIALDSLAADTANSIHARIPAPLNPGSYRVEWQTGSADGHTIRGEFAFELASVTAISTAVPSVADTTTRAVAPQPSDRDESGFRTARWIEFVALLTVLGALGFRHGVLPPLAARNVPTIDAADRARRLGQSLLLLYVVAALVRLYTQWVAVNGQGSAMSVAALTPIVTRTTWGIGWSAGVIGALLVLAGWSISKRSVTIGTPLALSGGLGMVLSPALSGHAAATHPFVLSVTLDMLHIAAAGLWLGGLLMVLLAGIPAMLRLPDAGGNTHAAVSALVNSFHPLALFCAPITLLAGLGTAWLRLGGLGGLSTDYGRTLILKVVLVALVGAMGAYNSLRVRRTISAADGVGTRRFRVTGGVELALGALVLIVTTFLVVTPVPSEMLQP